MAREAQDFNADINVCPRCNSKSIEPMKLKGVRVNRHWSNESSGSNKDAIILEGNRCLVCGQEWACINGVGAKGIETRTTPIKPTPEWKGIYYKVCGVVGFTPEGAVARTDELWIEMRKREVRYAEWAKDMKEESEWLDNKHGTKKYEVATEATTEVVC